jgi:energy-coupling factor transport system ATP-binding protein
VPQLRTLNLEGHLPRREAPRPGELPWRGTPNQTLEVQDLTVHLGGRTILDRLSFSASSGQVVAIVGRNGVGKTTLLRALAGLQKHDGHVTMAGERPDLGLVFQIADLQLFNASVRQEILYRLPQLDETLYDWLILALGLAPYEEVPPLLLSEGEKKRVALATVLMRRPVHGLLLDEPSLGQDAAHKEMLIRLARALADAGQLVILTTHDLPLALQADRLLLLGPGGFVADGPPACVLGDRPAWDRLGLVVPDWLHPPVVPGEAPPGPGEGEAS